MPKRKESPKECESCGTNNTTVKSRIILCDDCYNGFIRSKPKTNKQLTKGQTN